MHGAFQTFKKVYLHHADKVILTILLTEIGDGRLFIKISIFFMHIFEGVE